MKTLEPKARQPRPLKRHRPVPAAKPDKRGADSAAVLAEAVVEAAERIGLNRAASSMGGLEYVGAQLRDGLEAVARELGRIADALEQRS